MNKKRAIYRMLFLLLLASAAAASYPLVSYVNTRLAEASHLVIKKVEEATSLKVSYSHLSPAILWNVNMRQLVIRDAKSDKRLVTVRRITLRYSLWRIIKKDIANAFSALAIDGVNIDINENDEAVQYLLRLITQKGGEADESNREGEGTLAALAGDESRSAGEGSGEEGELGENTAGQRGKTSNAAIADIVREAVQKMHVAVSIRHVNFHYKGSISGRAKAQGAREATEHSTSDSPQIEMTVALNRVSLRRRRQDGNIRFTTDGLAQVQGTGAASGRTPPNKWNTSTSFKADITMKSEIAGSTAVLRLRDLSAGGSKIPGTVAVKAINLLTRYDEGVVTVETIQSALPLAAKCAIDTSALSQSAQVNLSASLKTASLPISSVFLPNNPNDALLAVLDSAFTTDSELTLDFGGEGHKAGEADHGGMNIAYHSMGSVTLPDRITKKATAARLTEHGGINVEYSLMGDDSIVRLTRLAAKGNKCDVAGNMVYYVHPMQLTGVLDARRVTLPNGNNVSGKATFGPLTGGARGFAITSPQVAIADGKIEDVDIKIMPRTGARNGRKAQTDLDFSAQADLAGGKVIVSGSASKGNVLASVEVQQCYLDGIASLAGIGDKSASGGMGQSGEGAQGIGGSTDGAATGQLAADSGQEGAGGGIGTLAEYDASIATADPFASDVPPLAPASSTALFRLKDFMAAGEAYISIDNGQLSYNVPYALVANTQRDNEALYLSLDGNKDTINVSQLDVAYGNNGANITAHVERDGLGGAFFTLETIASMGGAGGSSQAAEMAVPYRFSGSITGASNGGAGGERLVTVSDEYGSLLQASLRTGGRGESGLSLEEVTGNLVMSSFPLRAGKSLFSLSTETGFAWTREEGIAIKVNRFETAGEGGGLASDLAPRFVLSGEVTKYGAFFDQMSYTDAFSALYGSASAFLNMNGSVFDSARLDFNLSSAVSGETITFDSEVTNPSGYPLTLSRIKEDFFFNTTMQLKSFALSRFVSERSENNTLTASLDASGTLDNPYVSLNVTRASMMFASVPIVASGKAFVMDKVLTVADTKVRYGGVNITDVNADLNMASFTGGAQALLDIGVDKSLFSMPMTFSIMDTELSRRTHLPISFTASIDSAGATGAFLKEPFPFNITVMRSEKETAIFSSDNLGISGYLVDGGEVNITSNSDILAFNLTGKNDWTNLDLYVSDLNVNIASIASHFNNDKFAMYHGSLTGGLAIGGIRSDPDFMGELAIENADFSLLKVVPYHITGQRVPMLAEHNEVNIPETLLSDKGKGVFLSGKIMLDRWLFDNMELFVRTPTGATAPALLDIGMATFEGDASIDLTVGIDRNKTMEVTGDVYVENTKANVRAREVMNMSESMAGDIFSRRIDVDITMGQHIFVTLDPLLRAVLTPKSQVNFKMDESTDSFSLKGDVGIKSGDIAWFNRSFYLKDGFIRFNDNEDNFDPTVTLRAETRDRDDDGKDVKITMSASNQPLSRFSPKFSSVPVKSEAEIRAMLGQIAVGDSDNASDVMLSMGDFAVAATVGRAVENTIRDLFKFDIFSIRTMALQNVFKNSMNNDQTNNNNITAGNLLDNSTVYIGKYIGSVIYLDAMLRLSYDEHKDDDIGSKNGILFQPEIGFELDAPFAGIRWSIAPDLDAMKENMFKPITSVTLSWGFSF